MAESLLPPRSPTDLFGDPIDAKPPWFNSSAFLGEDFDPDSYVADLRTFVPLESLAAELRSYLADLKAELIDLINRDYADFIGLSTRLVDVDSAAARMRAPLVEFRDKVATFRAVIDAALTSIRSGLRQRAEASAAREILELLLDTFHVVSKVEKLIKELPSSHFGPSNTEIVPAEKVSSANANGALNTEVGPNHREDQSILLERIASEMNRLKFYISHAQDLPFIENMEKRIQNVTLMLDGSLGNCFVDGLKHQDAKSIYNCLRAYAAIDNTSAAEELFRTVIVSPMIQKIIPHDNLQVVSGASLDELEDDYQQIMQGVKKDCKFLLDISSTANSGFHVFSFLANSILREVLIAIQKGKPGAFSPGRPAGFLKNYKSSLGFLAFLEGYCPSKSAVVKFRLEVVYLDFIRQWNVGVYFSLRFQEIAGALDSALMASKVNPVDIHGNHHKLTLKQSITLMESLKSCWSDDVLIIAHSDKFLRLSLQLISRYSTWLFHGLSARKSRNASTNASQNFEWAISAQVEIFVYVMHDITVLVGEICGDYLGQVLQALGSCSGEVVDLVRQSILQAGRTLEDLLPSVLDTMIEAIVEKSVEDLRQLKGVTATYRMTNKLPVRPSPYVSLILRPLKVFFEGELMKFLTKDAQNQLLHGATEKITTRYYELASDTVNVARKTESSLLRLRQGAQRRVGATSDAQDNNISDTEKICMQLFLDIQEYGRNLSAMGVEATEISAFRSLWQCVAPEDRQSQITF
ncbi:conserved oligomeric Golgi complex subunit 2-like isoform X2 [Zingiber officinale]|uniref:conserved oligomeric Golgi complex subunit 2-like isoform X1 n=2 Tax=Zingiber officinale TaxID=94328 RepID=UPI001C4B82F8|nr:conserved oligomeric Golgi complex subunit 2-like isoform X1 [Zingiber officinale]XP_042426788.1 conserved oligomeric Golgi complex subunit 2-like isoform X2 [Zingiber officinale]